MTKKNEAERERGKRSRKKRLLWVAVAAIGSLILFVLLLPTIITLLPAERWIANAVNERIDGRMEMGGLRVGWFSPVEIAHLSLVQGKEPAAPMLLMMEDFETENGIYKTLTSAGRMGKIRIDHLYIHASRDADGVVDWTRLMPPADEEEEPAPRETAGPPERLGDLLPKAELPLNKLRIMVDDLVLQYVDETLDPPLFASIEGGKFDVTWDGEGDPMEVRFAGRLNNTEENRPFELTVRAEDWTRGGAADFSEADVYTKLLFDEKTAILDSTLSLSGGEANAKLDIDAGSLGEIAAFVRRNGLENPLRQGSITARATASLRDYQVHFDGGVETRDVVMAGGGKGGEDFALPAVSATMSGFADPRDVYTHEAALKIDSPVLNLNVTDAMTAGELHEVGVSIAADFGEAARIVKSSVFDGPLIPRIDASLEMEGSFEYGRDAPRGGEVSIQWRAGEMAWEEPPLLPGPIQLKDGTVDLSPTTTNIAVTVEPEPGGVFVLEAAGGSAFAEATAGARLRGREAEFADVEKTVDLERVFAWMAGEIDGLPVSALSGTLVYTSSITNQGESYLLDGSIGMEELEVESGLLPAGSLSDSVLISWSSAVDPDMQRPIEAHAEATSRFLKLFLTGSFHPDGPVELDLSTDVYTDEVFADFVEPIMPGLAVETTGTLRLETNVGSGDFHGYDVALTARSLDDFALDYEDVYTLPAFTFSSDAGLLLAGEKIVLNLRKAALQMEDVLELGLSGMASKSSGTLAMDFSGSSAIDYAALLARIEPAFQALPVDSVDVVARTAIDFATSGTIHLAENGFAVVKPVGLAAVVYTTIESLDAAGTFGNVSLSNAEDSHVLWIELREASAAGMELRDETTFSAESVVADPFVETGPVEWEARLGFLNQLASADIRSATFGAPFLYSETYEVEMPEVGFSGSVEYDMATGGARIMGLRTFMADVYTFMLDGAWSAAERRLKMSTSGTVESLEPVDIYLIGEDDATEVAMSGRGGWAAELLFDADAVGKGDITGGVKFDADAEWRDVSLEYGKAVALRGFRGRAKSDRKDGETSIRIDTYLDSVAMGGEELPLAGGLFGHLFARLADDGGLYVEESDIRSRPMESRVSLQASVPEFLKAFDELPEEMSLGSIMDLLSENPFNITLSHTQELGPLSMLEMLSEPSGSLSGSMTFSSDRARGLEAYLYQQTDNVRFTVPGLMAVGGLNGNVSIRKQLVPPGSGAQAMRRTLGGYRTGPVQLEAPFALQVFDAVTLDLAGTNTSSTIHALMSLFLGGSANFHAGLQERGNRQIVTCEFVATEVDGATIYPALKSKRLQDRTLNAFGSLSLEFAPRTTVTGLVEGVVLSLELTEIGPAFLREALRVSNAENPNPGIDATLAAMYFSRPVRVTCEIRNGLLSMSIMMSTPTGAGYGIPIFDRTRIAPLAARFATPEANATLSLVYTVLRLYGANTTDDVSTILFKEEM